MIRTISLIIVLLFISGCAAMQPKETLLLQQRRFGEMKQLMEDRIQEPANAPFSQLFYLCYAYSRVKNYNKLFPCLEHLQADIDKGDYKLFIFDFTAAPALMRAEAWIELGDYQEALEEAEKAYQLTSTKKTYLQLRIYALTAIGLVHALMGNQDIAEKYAGELKMVRTSYPNTLLTTDKLVGLAKIYMALGKYDQALAAIKEDEKTKAFKATMDLITGASFAGESLFTYWELPKQYMLNKSLMETGHLKDAKAGYDQLLQMPQTAQNGDIYWLILFDRGLIAESGLMLVGDKENDGFLSVGELFTLRLDADLVTLSACDTAMGEVADGDEMIGFTRGFLYAGASSIVSSLWSVDDRATRDLMIEFYRRMRESYKMEALRQAQMMTKERYKHPFYWAPFQLIGNAR